MLLLMIACSSPTATITTGPANGETLFPGLSEFSAGKLQRGVDTCYAEALKEDPALSGTATVTAVGSHGILKVEGTGPDPLVACVKDVLEDSRNQRTLGEGDNTVGATFTVTFTP